MTHTSPPEHDFLDGYALERIDYRVRQLTPKLNMTGDWDDLRHDMIAELLTAAGRFDPSKATRETFIARVLDKFENDILRKHLRQRSHPFSAAVSLDDSLMEDDSFEDQIAVSDACDQEGHELRIDVDSLIEELPTYLQEVCGLLKYCTLTEAADELKISRQTLYRYLEIIREHFAAAGFDDFPKA